MVEPTPHSTRTARHTPTQSPQDESALGALVLTALFLAGLVAASYPVLAGAVALGALTRLLL